MGMTIPLVPSTEIPPVMPSLGLKVFAAVFSPSGMVITTDIPQLQPQSRQTSSTLSAIILRGVELMAALPTG